MDQHRIKIIFRIGDEIATGTIVKQLTPRRLIVRPAAGDHGLDCRQTFKIILARTNRVVADGLADGVGFLMVNPRWEQDGAPFPSEYVYKFDETFCWTLVGHRHRWENVEPIYIDDD